MAASIATTIIHQAVVSELSVLAGMTDTNT